MSTPLPPGSEGDTPEMLKHKRELAGFGSNACVPDLSNYKGRSYIYKFKHFDDPKLHHLE